jgi:lysophospholipase L1-like esterase
LTQLSFKALARATLAGAALLFGLPAAGESALGGHPCQFSQGQAQPSPASLGINLANLKARIASGQRLRIVMLGSSSTEGPNPEDRSRTYPAAAARTLQRLWGPGTVEVVNKGVSGEAVPDMLKRFDRDIYALKPDLVIWQLGVNDLFRFSGPEIARLEPVMRKGLHDIRAHGIPVVLLDLQYAPRVLKSAHHDEMEGMIGRVAKLENAGLFQRFDLMRRMAGNDAGAGALSEKDGLHMRIGVHACMGQLLGEAIAASVAQVPRQELAGQIRTPRAQ